jgi:hypothetical protein
VSLYAPAFGPPPLVFGMVAAERDRENSFDITTLLTRTNNYLQRLFYEYFPNKSSKPKGRLLKIGEADGKKVFESKSLQDGA